jgi:RNA polymerase sigma-70 factor (ECF subfamily)
MRAAGGSLSSRWIRAALLASPFTVANFSGSPRVLLVTDNTPWGAELDQVLIRRCRAGDDEAFALLFEQYKNLVYRTTYLTLGTAAEADDILQEVFLQVHRSLDSYDPSRGAFTTWLHRITVNRCLNWRRCRLRSDSFEEIAEEWPADETLEPDRRADRYSDDECVRRALRRLSPKLRVAVILRHYWDLSYAEIAEIMDLPLGTIKSRLNLAMRLMHDDLRSDFPCSARSVTEA